MLVGARSRSVFLNHPGVIETSRREITDNREPTGFLSFVFAIIRQ